MRANLTTLASLGLNPMTADQCEEIHLATLEVLERTGVKIFHADVLEMLEKAGARVSADIARLPSTMVRQALQTAPCRVAICDRSGKRTMYLEKGRSYYGTGSDTLSIHDLDSGSPRLAVKQDTVNAAVISDAMEHVDFIMSMGLASDVPRDNCYIHQFEAMVLNSSKPIIYTADNLRDVQIITAMAAAACGGMDHLMQRPFACLYSEPVSPLQHSRNGLDKLIFCARHSQPIVYIPAVMQGATGPVTPAGALVVAAAEGLSGLVIHQLVNPGAPYIFGGGIPPMDMQTSVCSYGAVEEVYNCAMLTRLGQYYDLPTFTTGGCSDAHVFDQQAAMEGFFGLLVHGLVGANLIHDLGYLGLGIIGSMEMLCLCNEAVGIIKRFQRGLAIEADQLALEVIDQVGPGGEYLSHNHTLKNFRDCLHPADILSRSDFDTWLNAGALTYGQRANRKVRQILENHVPKPLPGDRAEQIRDICKREDGKHPEDK
jgi:trimethylamine--corrinoid protein Co-methyltransferase